MRPLQVVIVKVALALGPLHAGRNFIQDACWDALFHKICELCIGVLHAGGKSLQEAEAERLSGCHEKAVSLRARRAHAFTRDLCQFQLLLLRERARVGALSQMTYDVRGELMLGCVLVPVLNDVLKGAAGFGVGVICCASEAGAVADWRPAAHDGFAEQVGKVRDASLAGACLRAERFQELCQGCSQAARVLGCQCANVDVPLLQACDGLVRARGVAAGACESADGCKACTEGPGLVIVHAVLARCYMRAARAKLAQQGDVVALQPSHRGGRLLQACFACRLADASDDSASACMYFCALRNAEELFI